MGQRNCRTGSKRGRGTRRKDKERTFLKGEVMVKFIQGGKNEKSNQKHC